MPTVDPRAPRGVRQRLAFRVGRFVLLALLLAEVSYVTLANAFLNLGGVERLLRSTDDIRVAFRSAWTLWPGRVHVAQARIVFQDHNLQWSLDAERLEVEVAFLPFLSKTLHATRVRGEGLVFRERQRVLAADANLPSTRALPPIPEYETPALVPAYVPAAPRTDLWRIQAENVDVGVVELWMEQFRYLGHGRARGAFRLHAGHHLWVGPAALDLDPGELRASDRVVAGRFFGHVDCVVHPFFVNIPVGREVFRYISANLDLHAEDVRLEPLDLFLPGTTLSSPGARLDLRIAADHGVLASHSHAELRGPELRGRHRDWVFAGRAFELGAHTAPDGLGELTFRVEDARASRSGKHRESRLTLESGKVAFATSSVDTSAQWGLARIDVAVSRLEIPSLSAFDDLAKPRGLRLEGGSARLDGDGTYSGSAIRGEGRAQLSRARGRVSSVGWELDGSAELSLGRVKVEARATDSLELTLKARRLAVIAEATRIEASDARVTANVHHTQGRGAARVRTTASELSIKRGLLGVAGKLSADVQLPAFDLARGTLRASAEAELASVAATSGNGVRGRARRVRLASALSLAKTRISWGSLEVSIPSFSVRAGDTALSAKSELRVDATNLDLANRRGSASSRLLVSDVSAVDAVKGAKCQWLSVPRAAVSSKLAFSPEGALRVNVEGQVDGARARWDDFEVTGSASFESRFREKSADPILVQVAAKQLRMKSGSSALEGWSVTLPELRAVSRLQRDRGRLSGLVRARAEGVEGRIGKTPVHADLAADLRLAALDLGAGQVIGSGDLRIDHAGLVAGRVRVDDWWGRVKIPLLRVVAAENLDALGDFRAELRDGLPALGMFAASGDLPRWLPDVLPLRQLEARGRFIRNCRTTDIVFEQASGGPLGAAGRIQTTPSNTRAAFLVQLWSPLAPSVGLVAHDDEVGVALLAGDDWLAEQFEILDDWASIASCAPPPESCQPEGGHTEAR